MELGIIFSKRQLPTPSHAASVRFPRYKPTIDNALQTVYIFQQAEIY